MLPVKTTYTYDIILYISFFSYIQLAMSESNVRSQDFFTVLAYVSQNPVGMSIVWDFVRDNWQYLVDRFTLNDRYLGRLIPTITKTFTSELKLRENLLFYRWRFSLRTTQMQGLGRQLEIKPLTMFEKISNG